MSVCVLNLFEVRSKGLLVSNVHPPKKNTGTFLCFLCSFKELTEFNFESTSHSPGMHFLTSFGLDIE
jgi:hypothetical protein